MKIKKIIFFTALVASAVGLKAQKNQVLYRPYSPVTVSVNAPKWMEQLEDIENVNYYAMVDSFNMYLRQNPDARRKKPYIKAVVNHFRRWQRAYEPFVTKGGKIKLPLQKDFRAFVEEANLKAKEIKVRGAGETNGWKLLSPIMTYDWETKKASPAQANVQRFDVSKSNPNVLYCGTETGMIFKTEDKGENWTPCTGKHYMGGEITTVEVSYTNPLKVLVGAGSILWLTEDGGNTWQDITPASVRNYAYRVHDAVFNPTNDEEILMGNTYGLYKSSDNGKNWNMKDYGIVFDIKYKTNDAKVVYTLIKPTYNGANFKISKDGGNTFSHSNLRPTKGLSCGRIGLSTAPSGGDYIYLWACYNQLGVVSQAPFYAGTPVLFKSKDAGQTWETFDNTPAQMVAHDRDGGQAYYDMVVTASSKNPEHILFGLLHLYRSEDGGRTFMNKGGYFGDNVYKFDLHCDMQDIHVVGDETWLSTDGGVIRSTDFFHTNAEARIKGIYASELWGFDQGWNEDVMVGGRNHNGNMSQLDRYNGATISMKGSERATGYVFLSNPRKVAYQDSENVYLPDDWKSPFVPFTDFQTYPTESTQFGTGFEFDPRYAQSFLIIQGYWEGDQKTLWKTTDDGASFVSLHEFPRAITSYVIARSNPEKIVVGTVANLYYSLDSGKTFQAYTNLPERIQNAQSLKVAIHPRNENEIWVSTLEPGEIYRTTDNGNTWQQINQNLFQAENRNEQLKVTRFFLTGNEKDAVYAIGSVLRPLGNGYSALRGRIFYWDKETNGWIDYSEGLPPVLTINRMLPFYKEGKIRIATNNGIWERDLKDKQFQPVAQPLILNVGTGENKGERELALDSYSIVNQEGATWEWSFNPQPLSVTDVHSRNPKIRIASDQSYDITLKVTNALGQSDTKTVRNMIKGSKEVLTNVVGREVLPYDVVLSTNKVKSGENLVLTPQNIDKDLQWTLYTSAGKAIQKESLKAIESTTISTQALTPGVYLYFITNGKFKKTGKLIIL